MRMGAAERTRHIRELVSGAFPGAATYSALPEYASEQQPELSCGQSWGDAAPGRWSATPGSAIQVPVDLAGRLADSPVIIVSESAGSYADNVICDVRWSVTVLAFIEDEAQPLCEQVCTLLSRQAPWDWQAAAGSSGEV